MSPLDAQGSPERPERLTPIRPRAPGCVIPATAEQLRTWREIQGDDDKASLRVCASSARISGALASSLLSESLAILVQRHESLRTRIVSQNGILQQQVDTAVDNCFEMVNVASADGDDPQTQVTRLAQQFADEEFRLSTGPIFKVKLFRLSPEDHVLVLMIDHIVSDAISWRILNDELWHVYDRLARREPTALAPLPIQYADYAVWQEQSYPAWLQAHQAYWTRRFANAPGMQGQPDRRALETAPDGTMLHFTLGKRLTSLLHEVAERAHASIPVVVLCLYVAALSRWLRRDDIVIGFLSHGRYARPELENMVGFLVNSLHLRAEVKAHHGLLDLLRHIQVELDTAYIHQDFGQIARFLPRYNAELFFNWVPGQWAGMSLKPRAQNDSRLRRQAFPLRIIRSIRVFYGFFYETASGIGGTFQFNRHLIDPESVGRLQTALRSAAEELVRDSTALESATPLGSEARDC